MEVLEPSRGANLTTFGISTVGECAELALASFSTLRDVVDEHQPAPPSIDRRLASVTLVHACLMLLDKFPHQSRRDFASVLPFSSLELELLRNCPIDTGPITDQIADRLLEWVNRSPILVEEASVHAADFLRRLTAHLDLWSQREQAEDAIERLIQA